MGLDTRQKLDILSADSQYDLACACATGKDEHRRRGLDGKWLYPVPMVSGGTGIMLKTLLSNACANDCKYCPLRSETNVRRCALTPEEIARFFMEYQRQRRLLGLFLSSGVIGTPDATMERLNAVAAILRYRYHYKGYIHLKIIPGASPAAVEEALSLATAVSLNIEAPGARHFQRLSDCKNYQRDIIEPLKFMAGQTAPGQRYARVKCTTQFIVGASDENDREIVRYMDGIYHRLKFERIYFSAYQPGLGRAEIPGEQRFSLTPEARFTREHRLYQADFLMRQYGFDAGEMMFGHDGNFSLDRDPKEAWADGHPEFFPVYINRAEREVLLRVPGLGPVSVKKIIAARRQTRLRDLATVGITGKLAIKAGRYLVFS
ncbi:MAG: radical SAM protein [Victivallales bacterium]|nr:radical SAM protein [Victivallales bacterium]